MTTIMEGWLQVPPERNLIGRAAWKIRYVRFGIYSPTTPTSARSAVSPVRPTTATGVMGSGGTGAAAAGSSGKLAHNTSERKPQAVGPPSNELEPAAQLPIYLTLYKQKNDTEPITRYPLTSIASCYIGDVASRHKKKSVVLPTLVVNLRAEIQLSSTKSFRRRSHDVPAREGAKKEGTGKEILLFRPAPDNVVAIEKWAKEIQAHLIPSSSDSNTPHTTDSSFREKFSDIDLDTRTPSSSLFLLNGEPSTALLSPSLRSRASNLSSIESDDKDSVMSSSTSEMPSPAIDGDFPRSSGDGRPPLHVSTSSRHSIGVRHAGDTKDDTSMKTPTALPARRETILDRFFSTAPPSPSMSTEPSSMNSIARFEALIRNIEYGQDFETSGDSILINHPPRIPSPTQRALEYVSSGLMKHSFEKADRQPSITYAVEPPLHKEPPISLNVDGIHHSVSRQASEASLGTTASVGGSTGGGITVEASLGVSNNKRHSLADFPMVRLSTTPPMFQFGASRRGSHSDIPRISESCDDELSPLTSSPGQSFSNHPRVTRPLFREFSF